MFNVFRILFFVISFIAVDTFSMDCDDNKKEYLESPLSTSHINERYITLPSNSSKTHPLIFEHFQEAYITHYLLDGNPIAKLLQVNGDMHFESCNQTHNFSLQNGLQVGAFGINTEGTFVFQQPVQAYSAYIACKSVDFMDTFFSESGLSIEADCCKNRRSTICSDIVFKGKYFTTLPGSSLQANNSAVLLAQQRVLNRGTITCKQHTFFDTTLFENIGLLDAHEMRFNGSTILNQGTLNISDTFRGKVKSFEHAGTLYVHNDCILEKGDRLITSASSAWTVGRDWKAHIAHLYLDGSFNIKNMHIFSHNFTSLLSLYLAVENGLIKAQENITNTGIIDATQLEVEANFINNNEGTLAATGHLLARANYVENSGTITADSAQIKADRYWVNKMHGIVDIKNGFGMDALAALNFFGLVQAQDITVNIGIGLNALGVYKAKNFAINGLVHYNAGLLIPQFDSLKDLFSLANLRKMSEFLFIKYVPYLGIMYSALKNIQGMYCQREAYSRLLLSFYRHKSLDMSDKIATFCGIKKLFSSSKQTFCTGIQACTTVSSYMNSHNTQIPAVQSPSVALNWKNYAKQLALDTISQFFPRNDRDVLVDINHGAMLGVNGHCSSWYNYNSVLSFFFHNTIETYQGYNNGCLSAYNLNVNATWSYETNGFIGGMNAVIDAGGLYVDGNVSTFGDTQLRGGYSASIGANIKAQKIGIQSKDLISIKEKGFLDSSNIYLDALQIDQQGKVKVEQNLVMDAQRIENYGTTEAQKIFLLHSKPIKGRRFFECLSGPLGLLNKGILNASEQLYADAYDVDLAKDSQVIAPIASFKSDTDWQNNGEIKTEQTLVEAQKKAINNGGINASQVVQMNGQDVLLSKTSDIATKEAHFKSKTDWQNDGEIKTEQTFVEAQKKATNNGGVNASQHFQIEAENIETTKISKNIAKNAYFKAKGNARIDGVTEIENGTVDAKGKITAIGKVGASGQLVMNAADIVIEKTSNVTANSAHLTAEQTIDNRGRLLIESGLSAHGKYVQNSGEIQADRAHIQADRYFWNSWGASVKVRKDLTIDALFLLNIFGSVDADFIRTHAGIDINLFGTYRANNIDMNSLLGLNAGILLPKFKSLDELYKLCTHDNAWKLGKNLAAKYIPFLGLSKTVYNLYDFYQRKDEKRENDDKDKKYQNDILNFYDRGEKLKKTIKGLYDNKDTCASEVIPALCEAKNMLTTVVQTGNQAYQTIHDNCADASSDDQNKDQNQSVSGRIADLQQKFLTNEANRPLSLALDGMAMPTISTAVSLFGPQLTRDSLCDVNYGLLLGVNGSSQSLYNINSGIACFANSYSVNAIAGINSGLLLAKDFTANIYKGYTNTGMCGGLNAIISAQNLDISGRIYALNNVMLRASENAKIDRNISGRQVTVKADNIASKATIKGEKVVLDSKKVSLQDGSNIQAQGGANAVVIKAQKSLEASKGSSIEASNVTVDAPEVDIVYEGSLKANNLDVKANNVLASEASHIDVKKGTFNVKKEITNAGTLIVSKEGTINAQNVTLAKTSHIELNNTEVNATDTIHNEGVVKANNSQVKCKNVEATETSNIAIKNSTLDVEKGVANAGTFASHNSAINIPSVTLTETSHVEISKSLVNVTDTVRNAGVVKADLMEFDCKSVEASETSDIAITNSELNVQENMDNAGLVALQDCAVNTQNVTLAKTSHVELNNTEVNATDTIHNEGVVKANNSQVKCKNVEASETSDIAITNSELNVQENMDNAGLVALQDCAVNTQNVTLAKTSHVELNNTEVNATDTIHNEGVVKANNSQVKCKNVEASETSDIAITNSELNVQENMDNAGLVALQDCAVNTQNVTLAKTSHVELNNTEVNATDTIHNEGVVKANNSQVKCKNVEASETSDIAITNSELDVEKGVSNAGTFALYDSAINAQNITLEKTSHAELNNTYIKADEGINNKGYVDVSGNVFVQAPCVDNSGTVEGDAFGLQTGRLDLRETSKINLNILSADVKAVYGEKDNSIAVNEYALVKTSHLDNHGSVQGPLIVQFEGDRSDLKCIGQVDHVQYSGTIEDDLPDLFADGHNDVVDVKDGGIFVLCAEGQDVHIEQEHEMAHTLAVLAKNVKIAKELRSDQFMFFTAKQNVNHNSLICKKTLGLAGNNIIAESHAEREYDGETYEDKHKKISIKGHSVFFQTQQDLMHEGVEVESEEGGTHAYVGRDLYCDASQLEKYNKKQFDPVRSCLWLIKTIPTVEDIYKTSEVCSYKSKGVNNINVGRKIYAQGTVFDAKGGNVINGTIEDCPTYDTHWHKEEKKYSGAKRGTESTESLSVEEKPIAFLGGMTPVINSDQKISIAFRSDAPKIIINAPEVECRSAKNTTKEILSKDATYLFTWERATREESIDIEHSPSYTGTIQTDAKKVHIEDVKGHAPLSVETINKNAILTRTQREEVHQQKKIVLRNRPTKPLILATCFAVSMGTSSLGATLGYKIAAVVGNSKIATALLANMFSAGLSSLSTQATQVLLTSDGHFNQAMHQFASADTGKNLLISMGAAGAMTGVGQILNKMGLPPANTGSTFPQRCLSTAPHQCASAGIKTAAQIAMGKDPKIALNDNARLALANIIGIAASGCVGDAYSEGKFHPLTHKVLHTLVGAVEGGIVNGIDGAIAGAIGAGVAETIADICSPKPPSLDDIVALEKYIGRSLTQEEVMYAWNAQLSQYFKHATLTGEISKSAGALAALLVNKDMDIAFNTASQAVNNNFFVLVSYGLVGASAAYSAYQIYNAYQEDGAEGLVHQLGVEVVHNAAGLAIGYAGHKVLFKVGNALYPTAELAVIAVLDEVPGLARALGGFKDTMVGACKKVAETRICKQVGGFVNNIEVQLVNAEQKAVDKVCQIVDSFAKNSVEQVVSGKVLNEVEEQLAKKAVKKSANAVTQPLSSEVPLNTSVIVEQAKQELTESQKFLENFAKEFFEESKAEIEGLKAQFNQCYKINDKWLKLDCEHFFGMDVAWTKKGKPSIGGFHHDVGSKVVKSEVFDFTEKVVYENGFWKAKVFYKGDFVKEATFFPSEWPREKVTNKIFEAYNNAIKSGAELKLNSEGKYFVEGWTNEGINIVMYITQKGCIKTIYPVFK